MATYDQLVTMLLKEKLTHFELDAYNSEFITPTALITVNNECNG